MLNSIRVSVLTLLILSVPCANAIEWTGDTGDFLDASNWDGDVPGAGDEALINNGGTAQLSSDVDILTLRIGLNGGLGSFEQTNGFLTAEGAFIGDNSSGTARITSGDFQIGNDSIHVGWRPGGVGELTIDGVDAFVMSADDFQLGREGTGTLNLSAGQLRAGFTVIGKFGTGLWNQSGGIFDQDFGDIEIGDGGRDDQAGVAGPRQGTLNLTGGFVQTAGHLAIGNRRGGGSVNIEAGVMAATGGDASNIYIGRGNDSSPGVGQATELRVVGDQSIIVATGSLIMNETEVSSSSTLTAQITGSTITPIRVSGNADISNGTLSVELDGYTPAAGDSWTLIQAGVELDEDFEAIDALVEAAGYDPMTHGVALELGEVIGPFGGLDRSKAPLPPGLDWEVAYTEQDVILRVIQGGNLPGDFNADGILDATDIDLLSTEVRAGTNELLYDVNNDSLVNQADRQVWVDELKRTYFGDSNLDGQFNSSDFVFVFQAGQYEDGVDNNSTWATGDWNGDTEFDSSDFVTAFQAGGFEEGTRPVAQAVPEPASALLLAIGLLLLCRMRSK